MAKILKFREKNGSSTDNLITPGPWEFRWSDRKSRHFIQMLKSESVRLEAHRKEVCEGGGKGLREWPPHFVLKGGMASTIQALFAHRMNQEKMRDAYYLAGLIDCMINQTIPLLRTDLIRDMYKKITTMKSVLNMVWTGSLDQVLLPVDPRFLNPAEYRDALAGATTMKALYRLIRETTDHMFDILSTEYAFYVPGRREEHG